MNAPVDMPPLLTGEVPPAPEWFARAVAEEPERSRVAVRGAEVEMLTWGKVGAPGLLFLHGKGAHADWWSFVAPFFSAGYRVSAISWSGMGRSGRREAYP
jgi:alpha-beta hydrolase superfamily lysophospholipase